MRHAQRPMFLLAEVAVPRALFQSVLEGIVRLRLAEGGMVLGSGEVETHQEQCCPGQRLRRFPVNSDNDEVCWNRIGNADCVPEAWEDDS